MIASTLGFIYTPDFSKVLLITKQKPVFHKDKINGLGGKCETGESSLDCIVREVKEEADILIESKHWIQIGSIHWTEWHVEVFAAIYTGIISNIKSLTECEVAWYDTKKLPKNIISNLSWLVPLGIDVLTEKTAPTIEIEYP